MSHLQLDYCFRRRVCVSRFARAVRVRVIAIGFADFHVFRGLSSRAAPPQHRVPSPQRQPARHPLGPSAPPSVKYFITYIKVEVLTTRHDSNHTHAQGQPRAIAAVALRRRRTLAPELGGRCLLAKVPGCSFLCLSVCLKARSRHVRPPMGRSRTLPHPIGRRWITATSAACCGRGSKGLP